MVIVAFVGIVAALVIPRCLNSTPRLNGTILKKEIEEHHFRGVYFVHYITIVETNRYLVSQNFYDHVTVGHYVYHE